MAALGRGDENDEPAINRLGRHSRQLFFELLLNGRTPIAMVGSGLSIIYGGVSWADSVNIALDYTAGRLGEAIERASGNMPGRLGRLKAAIDAYRAAGATSSSSDKYVALDFCSEALDQIDRLPRAVRGECAITDNRPESVSSFRAFMARLYKDDTLFVRMSIASRFFVDRESRAYLTTDEAKGASILDTTLHNLPDVEIHRLASHIYSLPFLRGLCATRNSLRDLVGQLERELISLTEDGIIYSNAVLPIDRRSLICLFLAHIPPKTRHEMLADLLSKLDTLTMLRVPDRPLLDPFRALQNWLRIRRYITLNFDYELEQAIMLDDFRAIRARPFGLEDAIREKMLDPDGSTGGLTRRFGDGLAASTDIYSDEAVARLFEFALDSPDYRAQVLHLHGRADRPNTMLLTDGDGNRQYRRNRRSRTALERALDVILTGNPILFVGIGLSESEITRALRELVSRGEATVNNPAFAIMAGDRPGTASWRQHMAFYRQYGIQLIASGLPSTDPDEGLARHLDVIAALTARVGDLLNKPLRSDRRTFENAMALKLVKPGRLALDASAFPSIVKDICSGQKTPIPKWQAESWRDYLSKLTNKLFTLATVESLRSLREGALKLARSRQLPSGYDSEGAPVDREGRHLPDALNVRESRFWSSQPRRNEWRHRADVEGEPSVESQSVARMIMDANSSIVLTFSPLGSGKGDLVRTLNASFESLGRPSLILNCNFGIEFESVVIMILRFLWFYAESAPGAPKPPTTDRFESILSAIDRGCTDRTLKPTIVLSGLERLIDGDGRPVAPELDLILGVFFRQQFELSGFQFIIVGSDGCREYICERLKSLTYEEVTWPPVNLVQRGFLGHLVPLAIERCEGVPARRTLLWQLRSAAAFSTTPFAPTSARSPAISAVLRVVLERWHEIVFEPAQMTPANRIRAELDREILGELAFVGLPIEVSFLNHLERPQARIADVRRLEAGVVNHEVQDSIERLRRFGLIVSIGPFVESDVMRVALHRGVLAEVRDRFGVRSGDELLSNSFSLTLALSMPTDLVVADLDIRLRMKNSVGRLRGSWKDTELDDVTSSSIQTIREYLSGAGVSPFDAVALGVEEMLSQLDRALRMSRTPMQVNIRAAAGIIRSFFSAASLVAQIPPDVDRGHGAIGEFEEHKRRLAHLIHSLRESQQSRATAIRLLDEIEASHVPLTDSVAEIKAALPVPSDEAPALYGSELVWLLNERAVIALLQGDLYEAQTGFADASEANSLFRSREFGQSWRRIEVNRSLLRIERGRIREAKVKLREVRASMSAFPVRSAFEDELIDPLIDSYMGLCEHLEGNYVPAGELFDHAIKKLTESGQQRALAITYIRRASLHFGMEERVEGNRAIKLALAAAESGRQMDIVWRARITRVIGLDPAVDQKLIRTIFREARLYARRMDLPRVEIQAVRGEADYQLLVGDLDTAGALAAEAMTIATRYGMVLQRIALRVLMGTIMLRRGDESGRYLLERATAHADRIGYQLQIDRAQQAQLDASNRIPS